MYDKSWFRDSLDDYILKFPGDTQVVSNIAYANWSDDAPTVYTSTIPSDVVIIYIKKDEKLSQEVEKMSNRNVNISLLVCLLESIGLLYLSWKYFSGGKFLLALVADCIIVIITWSIIILNGILHEDKYKEKFIHEGQRNPFKDERIYQTTLPERLNDIKLFVEKRKTPEGRRFMMGKYDERYLHYLKLVVNKVEENGRKKQEEMKAQGIDDEKFFF